MPKYTRATLRLVLPAALAFAAACGNDRPDPLRDSSLASDSALNRDLQLAGGDTAAQPQLQDVPVDAAAPTPVASPSTPAPAAPARTATRTSTRPAPAHTTTTRPAAPRETTTPSGNTVTRGGSQGEEGGGAVGSIAAGTTLSLASGERVCTNTSRVGETFTATTTESVSGSNGATIPAGARVTLRVTRLQRSENARDPVRMEFEVVSVAFGGRSYPLDARVDHADVERVRNQPKDKDVQKVVGGAVIGAIAGQVLGRNTKGTVIGAAGGAAAGAAAAAATANYEGCVNSGATMRVSLQSAVQVRV